MSNSDPTAIFEYFRAGFASNLLIAAVAHFHVFECLSERPLTFEELRDALRLQDRPARVLITALRSMDLVNENSTGLLTLSPLAAEHLSPDSYFSIADYIGLAADAPAVTELVESLRRNRPAQAAFIYKEGMDSAMEQESSARRLTL